jgi:hypothetical protein
MKRVTSMALLLALLTSLTLTPVASAAPQEKAPQGKNFLKNMRVGGALGDGGTFQGKVTVTHIGYDVTQGLVVSGILKGTATLADGTVVHGIKQTFTTTSTLAGGAGTAAVQAAVEKATCDILFLDLGPLSLDLLGLTVDLSRITLDINAVSGAGNLLGNLLCAVTGLLDPITGFLGLLETLGELLDLLNQINELI